MAQDIVEQWGKRRKMGKKAKEGEVEVYRGPFPNYAFRVLNFFLFFFFFFLFLFIQISPSTLSHSLPFLP